MDMQKQLCEGAQDEHSKPICDGPEVTKYFASAPWEGFFAHWCTDCARLAQQSGYTLYKETKV